MPRLGNPGGVPRPKIRLQTNQTIGEFTMTTKLYHHKTSGGAEYLTDTFIAWRHNGKSGKEGTVTDKTTIIVRIDGDITKDVYVYGKRVMAYDELREKLTALVDILTHEMRDARALLASLE
jgi:hypothetical protein